MNSYTKAMNTVANLKGGTPMPNSLTSEQVEQWRVTLDKVYADLEIKAPNDTAKLQMSFARHHLDMLCDLARAALVDAGAAFYYRGILQGIKGSLEAANKAGGAIKDTIWHSDAETLFDFIDSEIERASAIEAAPPSPPVDSVVVPVEATPEMCAAYYDLCRRQDTLAVAASDKWKAMIGSKP